MPDQDDETGFETKAELRRTDELIDRAADRLRELADRAAAEGGITAMLAKPLAEDAAFLRKLNPSLLRAAGKEARGRDAKRAALLAAGGAVIVLSIIYLAARRR
jgi:hypothetical protein